METVNEVKKKRKISFMIRTTKPVGRHKICKEKNTPDGACNKNTDQYWSNNNTTKRNLQIFPHYNN